MTRKAQREELRAWWASIGKARKRLNQMGFSWPGGQVCPVEVIRGLAKLVLRLPPLDDQEELAALEWLGVWLAAGRMYLPKEE